MGQPLVDAQLFSWEDGMGTWKGKVEDHIKSKRG